MSSKPFDEHSAIKFDGVPIGWNREPLSGTEQGEILATETIVPGQLGVARKLWLLRGHRLCHRISKSKVKTAFEPAG